MATVLFAGKGIIGDKYTENDLYADLGVTNAEKRRAARIQALTDPAAFDGARQAEVDKAKTAAATVFKNVADRLKAAGMGEADIKPIAMARAKSTLDTELAIVDLTFPSDSDRLVQTGIINTGGTGFKVPVQRTKRRTRKSRK